MQNIKVKIRKALKHDVGTICELGKSVAEFSVSDKTVNFWPENIIENAVKSSDVLIRVAEEQKVIGFIVASYSQGLKKATIENIFIQPDFRGKGIGDVLLRDTLLALSERGCEYVATLIPPAAQNAADLYDRAGFSQGRTFVWLDKSLTDSFRR